MRRNGLLLLLLLLLLGVVSTWQQLLLWLGDSLLLTRLRAKGGGGGKHRVVVMGVMWIHVIWHMRMWLLMLVELPAVRLAVLRRRRALVELRGVLLLRIPTTLLRVTKILSRHIRGLLLHVLRMRHVVLLTELLVARRGPRIGHGCQPAALLLLMRWQ